LDKSQIGIVLANVDQRFQNFLPQRNKTMRKFFAITALVIIAIGGTLIYASCSDNAAAQGRPTEPPAPKGLLAESSPIAAEPTIAPSPTIDFPATQFVLNDQLAEQYRKNDQLRQQNSDLENQLTQQGAQATADAWAAQENIATENRLKAEADAKTSEMIALNNEAIAKQKAEENKSKELDIEATDAKTRQIDAQAQARNGWLVLAGFIVLGVGVAVLGVNIGKASRKPEPVENTSEPQPESQNVQLTSEDGRSAYQHDVKITSSEKATLRRAVVELRGMLSRRRLNGENDTKTAYFSEERAEEILADLRRENADGVSLAVVGPNKVTLAMPQLYTWLGLPTPPSEKLSQEIAENPANPNPTPPQPPATPPENTVGEGVGGQS
jgi:hypothetical protein